MDSVSSPPPALFPLGASRAYGFVNKKVVFRNLKSDHVDSIFYRRSPAFILGKENARPF